MNKFIPDRVKIIDKQYGNILIRGSAPVDDGPNFPYQRISEITGTNLDKYNFAVLSVIDCVGERPVLQSEMRSLGLEAPNSDYWPPWTKVGYSPSIPKSGMINGKTPVQFYWWPFEGLPDYTDPVQFLTSPGWDFSGVVDLAHSIMMNESGNTVLYFHCMLGADRTGCLHSGYLMRQGESFKDACRVSDSSTPAGKPAMDYRRLREAYAEWMKII